MVTLCRAELRYQAQTAKYGGRYERVDRFKVYSKAKYRCYLCRVVVMVTMKPIPTQASLDHFIALCKGGDHTYENVRCCCRKCNMDKGSH